MRKALLLLLCVLAVSPLLHAQTSDPLATALVNAGMNPTQASAWATAFELSITAQKATLSLIQGAVDVTSNQVAQVSARLSSDEVSISTVQGKQATDQTNIANLTTSKTADEAAINLLKTQVAAAPTIRAGTCTLAAGTCAVLFAPAFTTAPKQCQVTPTATATPMMATVPTLTGFTVTSGTATDTQSVGYSCQ